MIKKIWYILLPLLLCISCGYVEESNFILKSIADSDGETFTAVFAWLTGGIETTALASPTNINQTTAYAIKWPSSDFDSEYFEHSTTVNSSQLKVKQAGNYFIAVTVPMTSALQRSCVRAEVRVNGTAVDGAIGESSYIRNIDNHTESSDHVAMLLSNLNIDDIIEIYVQGTALAGTVTVSPVASMYVEYIQPERTIFSVTATRTTLHATNLNLAAASLQWQEVVKSSGFTHDDGTNPENIRVDSSGDYLIFVNVPIYGVIQRGNIKVIVQVDDVTVPGGEGKQGYIRNSSGHNDASVHWSGLVRNVSANSVITVKTQQESTGGTIIIEDIPRRRASIFIERIDTSSDIFFSRATRLLGTEPDNWNYGTAQPILWENDDIIDSGMFTHSTSTNAHEITVKTAGDYLLIYNDSLTSTLQRANPKVTVNVNGAPVAGAETKCHYIRNSDPHNESSGTIVFLLSNLSSGDIISLDTIQEALAGQVDDNQDALLFLWRRP